jgi:hypothetical protein
MADSHQRSGFRLPALLVLALVAILNNLRTPGDGAHYRLFQG